jgi:VWFA-related protein
MTAWRLFLAVALFAQVFRSQTDAIVISVSVKKGSVPVAGLAAADFRLTDNGVLQSIALVTVEAIPIDVTLFLDSSGSTAGAQDRMKRDVRAIAAMLRPADRYRVLTIGVAVDEAVPWQGPAAPLALDAKPTPGISLIYDALTAALLHPVESGRRHLVVALTDGQDCGSVVDGPALVELTGRTEAVMHVIYSHSPGDVNPKGVPAWCTPYDGGDVDFVKRAAERTGGGMHSALFGDPAVKEFGKILDGFRASYVLRYTAQGVARAGWHAVKVDVAKTRGLTIHARSGYFIPPKAGSRKPEAGSRKLKAESRKLLLPDIPTPRPHLGAVLLHADVDRVRAAGSDSLRRVIQHIARAEVRQRAPEG